VTLSNSYRIAPLDQVGWLAAESVSFRDRIADVARWCSFFAGQVIYHAGDPSDGLYGLASGGLEVAFPLVAEEPVVIYRAEIGFWIGDAAELSERPRLVSISAATDCRLLHIPSRAIAALLKEQPEYWRSFYRLSLLTMATTVTLLSETLALSTRARVCRRLLQLTENSSEVRISQEEFAKLLGVARTTMKGCLADLENRAAIRVEYRKIIVMDRSILAAFRDEQ
jgi:CRP-like cAMP-binding protein